MSLHSELRQATGTGAPEGELSLAYTLLRTELRQDIVTGAAKGELSLAHYEKLSEINLGPGQAARVTPRLVT